MKSKIIYAISTIVLVSLACQALIPSSTDDDIVLTSTQETIPQLEPTAFPVTKIADDFGIQMVLVPAGEFTMGSENGGTNEQPVHQVYLDAFYMDIYEVTNALYETCVDAGGCTPPQVTSSNDRLSYYGNSQYDDYPMINVNWDQAQSYCEWRDASLPTEAQWEKAARGTDGRTYPWGEGVSCTQANYYDGNFCVGDTTEIGSYESGKSPYGIYDMAGNVWEWVSDWYDENYYASSPSSNPLGPASGEVRVKRGSAYFGSVDFLPASYRIGANPVNFNSMTGFRCVRSP